MKIDDINEIKELIRVVNETGIAELELQIGETRIRIRRASSPASQEVVMPAVLPVAVTSPVQAAPSPALLTTTSQESAPAAPEPKASENDVIVKSPIVGTYYDSPAPGVPPFVKVGDRVEPKQILCIIESMKLMNEIEAEIAGVVTAKFIENGRPVEYAESLFTIRPLVGS
jgi:acetyl-CoA carboxylase biotin carboxyl carrier protein